MHHFNVSLRSGFRVVMSVTISALKQCSVRLYLQFSAVVCRRDHVLFTLFMFVYL